MEEGSVTVTERVWTMQEKDHGRREEDQLKSSQREESLTNTSVQWEIAIKSLSLKGGETQKQFMSVYKFYQILSVSPVSFKV